MSTFTIPTTLAEVEARLNGVERLLTAKEWERAAIVAAFVVLGQQAHHGPTAGGMPGCSACQEGRAHGTDEFAAHGIAGLRDAKTIRWYVERWRAHRPAPQPGDVVDLDGLPAWAKQEPRKTKVDDIRENPSAAAEALADETFRQKVIDRLPQDTRRNIARSTIRSITEDDTIRNGGHLPVKGVDYSVPSPMMDGVIAQVEAESEIAVLIDKVQDKVKAHGRVGDDTALGRKYVELGQTLMLMLGDKVTS